MLFEIVRIWRFCVFPPSIELHVRVSRYYLRHLSTDNIDKLTAWLCNPQFTNDSLFPLEVAWKLSLQNCLHLYFKQRGFRASVFLYKILFVIIFMIEWKTCCSVQNQSCCSVIGHRLNACVLTLSRRYV